MSEISGLSNQYEKLSLASDNLNEAIIVFKKKRLLSSKESAKKYPSLSISEEEILEANAYIVEFIQGIKEGVEREALESRIIPVSIFKEYQEKLESINPYVLEEIPEVLKVLEEGQTLKKEHFETLENLLTALDFERTAVFKKLRAGRT